MIIQDIWQKFISLFRCFIPFRKPDYMTCNNSDEDNDNEYGSLTDF